VFLATVLFVPGGIAGVVHLHKRLWEARLLRRAAPVYARMALPVVVAFASGVVLVEMAYRASAGAPLKLAGWQLDARSSATWIAAVASFAVACLACRWAWRAAQPRWTEVSALIGEAR